MTMHACTPQATAVLVEDMLVAKDKERMADNVHGTDDHIFPGHPRLKRLGFDAHPICFFSISFVPILAGKIFHRPIYGTCLFATIYLLVNTCTSSHPMSWLRFGCHAPRVAKSTLT